MVRRFEIELGGSGGARRIIVGGELDRSTCEQLANAADRVRSEGADAVVIDLRHVSFIDSSGLRSVLAVHRRAEQEGWKLEIVRPIEQVLRIFRLTGAAERLPFVDTA